jgi:hypothetical protein
MFKRNLSKITVICFLSFNFCITIPEHPINDSEECVINFFNTKRRMREIQIENRNFTTGILGFSFGVGFWTGPIGSTPMLVLPYTQYKNKKIVEQIRNDYEKDHCLKKNDV